MPTMSRREAILSTGAASVALLLPDSVRSASADQLLRLGGRIKQSVARWCFRDIPLPAFCKTVAEIGLPAIDLLEIDDWQVVRDHGLTVSLGMVGAGTIKDGLNETKNHDTIVRAFEENIPKAAEAEVPNVLCFFGNRRGMGDAEAVDNSIACLNRCKGIAEAYGVTILVELLNSKVSHLDYIGDRTSYGVQVIEAVDSPRVKLLYDIYHMQIMEGDVIRTIRKNHQHIAHYHTGGVPGRSEIDETQELNYVAITKAVVETGFTGFYAHEFVPKKPDPIKSLREAFVLCDV